ncbi:hypothetical protein GCM10007301_50080 [Azorhizobium oxalatiphilum]|uniref:TonB C-terminal domain-containing protein n=1 Tax=Azorhizobium oxalatiphilum TaxID=980631 RepID=A0A917CEZ4_9HYPH|nr:TonB family protein [Azorhizobium oxalatiphilum]GGF84107.1 hypothetical protein GCM10007301_50080 [Azorhizobium oxalatiphilum]
MVSRRVVVGSLFATLALTASASAQTQFAQSQLQPPPAPRNRREWARAAWSLMARHRDVPRDMPDREAHFEARVALRLRRDGTLVDADITKSSGRPQLDASVMRMVARSSPFPPLPADMNPAETIILPVVFEFVQDPEKERTVINSETLYQSRRLMDRRRAEDRL